MEIVQSRMENGILCLVPRERIDSTNAGETGDAMNALIREHPGVPVLLDAEYLKYVSSAGLRLLLSIYHRVSGFRIINAGLEVYEILDMTGFTEIMPVEKAKRRVSVEGCEVIGEGANGKVYRLDPDTIIKVYRNADALDSIRHETELARRAFILGIPTAIPYDVVRVGETYGSVYELLNAVSMARLLRAQPEKADSCIDLSVKLLKCIHGTTAAPGEMPDMKDVAVSWAEFDREYLPDGLGDKLISMMRAVPESTRVLHGDYHIKNIMLQNGEALLIDMDTLAVGDPVFEFGSICNAYCGFLELDHSESERFLGIPYDLAVYIWYETLKKYFGTEDEAALTDAEEKSMIVGYTRLLRRTVRRIGQEAGRAQIGLAREHLIDLLGRHDSLTF